MGRKLFITTFGCRTNQADSAAIRESFLDDNYIVTDRHEEADVIVVNSCTVTHRSDQQVRQLTRKMRRENPSARILLTGCYAQRDPENLAQIEGLDAVVGNTRKHQLIQVVEEIDQSESTVQQRAEIFRDDFTQVRAIDLTPATSVGGKTRPYVKIQDGCDAKCSYCIIPSVRGPSRSVPPGQVVSQVEDLIERGFQEIVLTGIHMGTYGQHIRPRFPLDRLLRELVELPGLGQLRLSSVEPMGLSKKVVELASRSDKIAPHFHICLQSGSDRLLRKMLRPYNRQRFSEIVMNIRERMEHATIGTDVIVGFPGETEQDHQETLEFLEMNPFTYFHVFPYSDRSGTEAAGFQDKVQPSVIKRRAHELRQLSNEKNRIFRKNFLGRDLTFLTLTEMKDGMREALSGNYLKAKVAPEIPGNRLIKATVRSESDGYLIAEVTSEGLPV